MVPFVGGMILKKAAIIETHLESPTFFKRQIFRSPLFLFPALTGKKLFYDILIA